MTCLIKSTRLRIMIDQKCFFVRSKTDDANFRSAKLDNAYIFAKEKC